MISFIGGVPISLLLARAPSRQKSGLNDDGPLAYVPSRSMIQAGSIIYWPMVFDLGSWDVPLQDDWLWVIRSFVINSSTDAIAQTSCSARTHTLAITIV